MQDEATRPTGTSDDRSRGGRTAMLILDMINRFDFEGAELPNETAARLGPRDKDYFLIKP